MISQKLSQAINTQINREIYSAYLYLSMASYFDSTGLKGCANWMKAQYQEEMVHAMKMYEYLYERGARVTMLPIEAPPSEWASPLKAFEHTLEHEKKVTGLINALVAAAKVESDDEASKFLEWFVREQVEEEESAGDKVTRFEAAWNDPVKIKEIDAELVKRKIHN